MRRTATPPWQDRFQPPELKHLLAAMPKAARSEIEFVRATILGMDDFEERIAWRGVPWGWTLEYHARARMPGAAAWAYIIPNPGAPSLCTPMPVDMAAMLLESKKLGKPARDGVAQGKRVGSMVWAQWVLASRATSEEVVALVRHKLDAPIEPKASRQWSGTVRIADGHGRVAATPRSHGGAACVPRGRSSP